MVRTMPTNIYAIVSDIQAEKEGAQREPAVATFREIKERLQGIDDGTLYALLDAEASNGLICKRRTINGVAYQVTEE